MSQVFQLLPFGSVEEAGRAVTALLEGYPVAALVLVAFALVVVVMLGLSAATAVRVQAVRLWRDARMRAVRNRRDHRALVVVGSIKGTRGHASRRAVRKALEAHFGGFAFSAPVAVEYLTVDLETGGDDATLDHTLREADRILRGTNADLLVWGQHRLMRGTLSLRLMTPTMPEMARQAGAFEVKWNGRGELPDDAGEALAYAAARRVRPVLNRPQDYKPERLSEIVRKLDGLMIDPPRTLNLEMRRELSTDFASGALSLGERGGEVVWLHKAL